MAQHEQARHAQRDTALADMPRQENSHPDAALPRGEGPDDRGQIMPVRSAYATACARLRSLSRWVTP